MTRPSPADLGDGGEGPLPSLTPSRTQLCSGCQGRTKLYFQRVETVPSRADGTDAMIESLEPT